MSNASMVVTRNGQQLSTQVHRYHLLPKVLMSTVAYRVSERGTFTIEQAGIAKQSFEVIEAYDTIVLEDSLGNHTDEFEVRVWFASTRSVLFGFDGMLDQAIFHLDMMNLTGYLAFRD